MILLLTILSSVVVVFGRQLSRGDAIATFNLNGGSYGRWGSNIFCDDGHYVHGFALNVDIEGGDDEGAVSLKLFCENELISTSNADSALSTDGRWDNVFCDYASEQKIRSLQIRSGDKSVAIVSIKGECTNKEEIEPANGRDNWSNIDNDAVFAQWQVCPSGSAICGYNQLIEDDATTDKSGLNQVRFWCCRLPSKMTQFQSYWKQVARVGGELGGEITQAIKVGVTKSLTEWNEVSDAQTITGSLEQVVSYAPGGVGGSTKVTLTSQQSKTVTNKIVNSITKSFEKTVTVKCRAGSKSMYQYVLNGVEELAGDVTGIVDIDTQEIWCMSSLELQPKCPPEFCASSNSDCQHCTEKFAAFKSGIAVYEYFARNGDRLNHYYTTNGNESPAGYYLNGNRFNIYPAADGRIPIYRYYNGDVFDHFYTVNANELAGFSINQQVGDNHNGWFYEGIIGYCESTEKSGTAPLYRYMNVPGFDHYYTTTNKGATDGIGYNYEGIVCYVPIF